MIIILKIAISPGQNAILLSGDKDFEIIGESDTIISPLPETLLGNSWVISNQVRTVCI